MRKDNTNSWSTDSFIEEAQRKFAKELEREVFSGPTDAWKGFYISYPGFTVGCDPITSEKSSVGVNIFNNSPVGRYLNETLSTPPKPRLVKYSVLGKEVTRRYEINVDTGKTRLISIDWNV